jgi:hypothetical protein
MERVTISILFFFFLPLFCSVASVAQTETNNFPLKVCRFHYFSLPLSSLISPLSLRFFFFSLLFQWVPPETFATFEYSEFSDVWSWAIIALEIFHRGDPYPGVPESEIVKRVRNKTLRQELPSDLPPTFAQLLQNCWSWDPNGRPRFATIFQRL